MLVEVNKELCCGDGFCVKACPARNFYLDENKKVSLVGKDKFGCILCGQCVATCPKEAISLKGFPRTEQSGLLDGKVSLEAVENLIKTRRSIRAYKDKAVDREIINQALEIVRYAPTGSNRQLLKWVALDDPAKLNELKEIVASWLEAQPDRAKAAANYRAGYDVILRGAPSLIISCAPQNYYLSPQDCAIATAYLELVLHSMGLGSCWAGYVINAAENNQTIDKFFNIPGGYKIYGGVMLGYPSVPYKFVPQRKKPNLAWV